MENCKRSLVGVPTRDGEYGLRAVNELFKKGDLVKVGIIPYDSERMLDIRPGEVIFSNEYFCTVEVEAKGHGHDGRNKPMKIRYTFDKSDISLGLVQKEKASEDGSVALDESLSDFIAGHAEITRKKLRERLAS